jgi:hypothetical protein
MLLWCGEGEDRLLLFLRVADVTDSVQIGPRDDVRVVVVVNVHVVIAVAAEVDDVLIVFAVVVS